MSINATLLAQTMARAKTENGGTRGLGLRFYERLFAQYPAVRPLFTTPAEDQHKKLMASINAIVATVGRPDHLMPYLRAMAVRHLQYGTLEAHYPAVAENLVAVLGEHLSAEGEWTGEMREAWEAALAVVSDVMIDAANHPEQYRDELAAAGYQPDGFKAKDPEPWRVSVAY